MSLPRCMISKVIVSSSRALWCLPSVKKQKHIFFSFPRPWLFWISPKPNLIIVYTQSVVINTSDISYTNNLARPENCYTDRIFFFTFQFRSTCAGHRPFTPLCTRLFPKFWIPTVILKWIFQNCSVLSLFSVCKPDIRAYCGSLLAKRSEASRIKWFLIGLSEVIQLHSVIGWNRTAWVLFPLSATIFQSDSTI